jgi:hypothetical protein
MTTEVMETIDFRLEVGADVVTLPLPSRWSVLPVDESNQVVAIVDPDQDTGFRSNVVIQVLPESPQQISARTVELQAEGVVVLEGPHEQPDGSWYRIVGDWSDGWPIVQVERIVPVRDGASASVTFSCDVVQWTQLGMSFVAACGAIEVGRAG